MEAEEITCYKNKIYQVLIFALQSNVPYYMMKLYSLVIKKCCSWEIEHCIDFGRLITKKKISLETQLDLQNFGTFPLSLTI